MLSNKCESFAKTINKNFERVMNIVYQRKRVQEA